MFRYILIGVYHDATVSAHVEASSREIARRMWSVLFPDCAHYHVDVFEDSECGIVWKQGYQSSHLAKY